MPHQFPGVGVQRDYRVRVQIVAGAIVPVPARVGIARPPERQVCLGIVRSGHPDRAAAVLPRFSCPGFDDGFVRRHRRGVEAPALFAGLNVVGAHPAVRAFLIGGRPENDFVFDDKWSDVQLIALMPVDELPVPVLDPRPGVD